MSGQPTPPLFVKPFGIDAPAPDIQYPIPDNPAAEGRANLAEGFPDITMQPVVAGGIPPFGQDFNGILRMISAHTVAQAAGQFYLYSGDLATAMGGYGIGSILAMSDGTGLWINQLDGNTSDPDANGAGWIPLYRYGYTTLAGLTGGPVTPTLQQVRSSVIILTGSLVANLQVILPAVLREWLIVNATTGAFTATVKTASGTGVDVPQGGFASPARVYGDGTNLYPGAGTIITPSSVAPDPSTIVLRDNLGQLYGTRLFQSSAIENPSIGAVFVQDLSGDGGLRKINLTNFEAQLLLQNMGGVLINAQVPYGVVQQHAAALFTNPAFTGAPTAPTAALGTSTTQLATTAFANPPGATQTPTGWHFTLPNGFIVQGGSSAVASGNSNIDVVYPVPFTTFGLPFVSGRATGGNVQDNWPAVKAPSVTLSQFTVGGNNDATPFFWFAIGV